MRFLFWNLNRRPLQTALRAIVDEHDVDVVMLAESAVHDAVLLDTLNRGRPTKYLLHHAPSDRLRIFARLPIGAIIPVKDGLGVTIRRLFPPLGTDILLVVAHLKSKLHQRDADQILASTRLVRMIEEAEGRVGHMRTLLVGDLNMNPFEPGVAGAAGLHAVMSRRIAGRQTRIVGGEERSFFYNPMWSFFGEGSPGPPGTYFYRSSSQVCYYWNIFDQVLIRPELLPRFRDEDVAILTRAGTVDLLNAAGVPDASSGSDHLPMLFRLELRR